MGAKETIGIAALVATLSAGCVVGPNYRRPPAAAPAMFKEQPAPGSALAAEWKTAQPSDETIRADWWEVFGDPQLSAL